MKKQIFYIIFTLTVVLGIAKLSFAKMQSENYRIPTSVFSGGGAPAGSTNYQTDSTLGQPSPLMNPSEPPWSSNFNLEPGFWYTAFSEEGPNQQPVAFADESLLATEGMPCSIDASASYDPEGASLTYKLDFGDGTTLETTEAVIDHTYKNAGTYTVTLIVNDGELDSDPFTTQATIVFSGGGQGSDVDSFLSFFNPEEKSVHLPEGTTSYDVEIMYGNTIIEGTFEATLNREPFSGFNPVAGTRETVTIPLSPRRNTLNFQVDGVKSDGKTDTDHDTLTFIVR